MKSTHHNDLAQMDWALQQLAQQKWNPPLSGFPHRQVHGFAVHRRLGQLRSLKHAALVILLLPLLSLTAYCGRAFYQDFVVGIEVVDHEGRSLGKVPARVRLDKEGRVSPIEFAVQEQISQAKVALTLEGEGHTEESVRAAIGELNNTIRGVVQLDHPADLVAPTGHFTRQDIAEFLALFELQIPQADLAEPKGVWDSKDILAYLDLFAEGREAALQARAEGDQDNPHWPGK
ncbi:MAG: hypothetical protein DWQ01_10110 [Planctomycetota bacterium]|nr:MAG: hypothetical protein DWQ01_10110 [Planctomycetota bacterium]